MNPVVTTLFEGDYHLGAAALLNSLHAAGFTGLAVCGHRGPPPPWAAAIARLAPMRVEFIPLTTTAHLTNHKPDFLHHVWTELHPTADQLFYLDPDIILKTTWDFLAEWAGYGVALVDDVNSPLPATHPRRAAWRRALAARATPVTRETNHYVNGGFIGLSRAHLPFLVAWQRAMTLVGEEIGGLERSMFSFKADHSSPAFPYNKTDQDALNLALMTSTTPVSIMGSEGMDFRPGGWTLSHAIGAEKPWRKPYLRAALAGRNPSLADHAFWAHTRAPLPAFSSAVTAQRRATLAAASLLGRLYRRAG